MPRRLHRCVAFDVNARNEVKESQQSAMNMFNEQKRHESQIDEVSCSNKVVD